MVNRAIPRPRPSSLSITSSQTTIGLGTVSGRLIFALGEIVIRGIERISTAPQSISDSESTSIVSSSHPQTSLPSQSGESQYTIISSSTVPGLGEVSGRAIKALGAIAIRGMDNIDTTIRQGLAAIFTRRVNMDSFVSGEESEIIDDIPDFTR